MHQAVQNIDFDDENALAAALQNAAENGNTSELVQLVLFLLKELKAENHRLHALVAKLSRRFFSKKSEKINPAQLALFKQLLGGVTQGQNEDTSPADTKTNADAKTGGDVPANARQKKQLGQKELQGHGRSKLSCKLERVNNVITVPERERVCGVCQEEMPVFSYATSERLDYVPAKLRVVVDRREKRSCKRCQQGVAVAPAANKTKERGLATESLLAHVAIAKYIDGMPLNRISSIWARQGAHLPKSTLSDFVKHVSEELDPVAKLIKERVLASYCIGQDDTGLTVLDRESAGGSTRGHIFAFCGDEKMTAFLYAPNWQGTYPCAFLAGYNGFVQGDGYAGINRLFGQDGHGPTRVACAMHVRRYFYDAYKAGTTCAGIAVAIFNELYEVESRAKKEDMAPADRLALRQQYSMPLLKKLRSWLDQIGLQAPPKTELGKAVRYANNHWQALMVAFSDGRLEIDNGLAERNLRLPAMGRKAWLFAGSHAGGERAATVLTVLGTARAYGVNLQAYLTWVLQQLAGGLRAKDKAKLLPAGWAEQTGQQLQSQALPDRRLIC